MSKRITAGIVGAAGYTGGETIRLLLNHSQVDLVFVQSRSQAGKHVAEVHPDLAGDTTLHFTDEWRAADVLFLCMGHGESKNWLATNQVPVTTRLIDLGNDFRLGESVAGRAFVYGLPELQRDKIKAASNIANPGCFATAIQLSLLPLAQAGLLGEAHTTGITGSTGAGQKLQDTTHFTWRANNISAYKTLTHQHLAEIKRSLQSLQSALPAIHFIPWRGDFTRGIFTSTVLKTAAGLNENRQLFQNYYQSHPFTHVLDRMIDLKQVINTNKCLLFLEQEGDQLVIHSALDNLLKGASGQAVQNMNLMFGWNETTGLALKSLGY
jgi:N-acetyl-gamma-glutamyl-phosphate reductase